MTEYRCYFAPKPSDNDNRPSLTNTLHILQLESDEAARLAAQVICTLCDHVRGYEIWQGDRLVFAGGAMAEAPALQVTALSA